MPTDQHLLDLSGALLDVSIYVMPVSKKTHKFGMEGQSLANRLVPYGKLRLLEAVCVQSCRMPAREVFEHQAKQQIYLVCSVQRLESMHCLPGACLYAHGVAALQHRMQRQHRPMQRHDRASHARPLHMPALPAAQT